MTWNGVQESFGIADRMDGMAILKIVDNRVAERVKETLEFDCDGSIGDCTFENLWFLRVGCG